MESLNYLLRFTENLLATKIQECIEFNWMKIKTISSRSNQSNFKFCWKSNWIIKLKFVATRIWNESLEAKRKLWKTNLLLRNFGKVCVRKVGAKYGSGNTEYYVGFKKKTFATHDINKWKLFESAIKTLIYSKENIPFNYFRNILRRKLCFHTFQFSGL